MQTKYKTELVEKIAEDTGIPQTDVNKVVKALVECICVDVSKGIRVALRGLGSFSAVHSKATSCKLFGGETVDVPARHRPVFRPSDVFKDRVKEGLHGKRRR